MLIRVDDLFPILSIAGMHSVIFSYQVSSGEANVVHDVNRRVAYVTYGSKIRRNIGGRRGDEMGTGGGLWLKWR